MSKHIYFIPNEILKMIFDYLPHKDKQMFYKFFRRNRFIMNDMLSQIPKIIHYDKWCSCLHLGDLYKIYLHNPFFVYAPNLIQIYRQNKNNYTIVEYTVLISCDNSKYYYSNRYNYYEKKMNYEKIDNKWISFQ